MTINITIHDYGKSIKMLSHELMEKIEELEGKKYLMTDDSILDKVLDKVKLIIGIENFDDGKILTDKVGKILKF